MLLHIGGWTEIDSASGHAFSFKRQEMACEHFGKKRKRTDSKGQHQGRKFRQARLIHLIDFIPLSYKEMKQGRYAKAGISSWLKDDWR